MALPDGSVAYLCLIVDGLICCLHELHLDRGVQGIILYFIPKVRTHNNVSGTKPGGWQRYLDILEQ